MMLFLLASMLAISSLASAPPPAAAPAATPPPAATAAPPPNAVTITRLAAVGRLWGKVRYLHPYLAYRDIDWDAALIHALPKVRAARDTAEYRAAAEGMLAELGDPATHVRRAVPPAGARPPAGELIRPLDGAAKGGLLIDLGHQAASQGGNELLQQLETAAPRLAAAPELVIDLRLPPGSEPATWTLSFVAGAIISRSCPGVSSRYLVRSGYAPQMNLTGTYFVGFLQRFATAYEPDARLKPVDKRVAFITDRATPLPELALALQACGEGRIVAVGAVGGLDAAALADTIDVPLGEALTAQVRVSELLPREGDPAADAIVAEADAAQAVAAARASLAIEHRPPASPPAKLAEGIFRFDRAYPEMLAPDLDYRQLAVISAWNVIELFYPYRHLIGDWDAVLPEFLARMEAAEGDRGYALEMLEMMNRVADGHVGLSGHPVLDHLMGSGVVAARLRWVEGGPVIVQVSDAVRQAGAVPGDAVRAIDGEPVEAVLARLRPLATASTEGGLHQRLCSLLLRGKAGATADLTLKSPQGIVHHAAVAYGSGRNPLPTGASTHDVVQILPGNLGYVDLTRLTVREVDGMFERLKDTRGLVFDMRGYPQGTAWAIAPRINTKHAKVGAQFRRVELSALSTADESHVQYFFEQLLPEDSRNLPLYDKPIAMIIDARAISQAEHSGLFFEAASDIHFVGENSAGANGDVTVMKLPGGIQVSFTGHDVRHADGRQLQRIGLVPDVPASPTRAGLAAGRDEVLEAAIADLERRAAPR